MFVVHECIHGIFFKLFSPKNKVYFGAANGMIYCAIPGDVYTVYVLISSIAPFVIITMLFIVTLFLGWFPRGLFSSLPHFMQDVALVISIGFGK